MLSHAIRILGGTLLTGRVGKGSRNWIVKYPADEFETTNATNFTVARCARRTFSSEFGYWRDDRQQRGSERVADYNRAYGVDGNFRFGRYTNVNTYLAKTFSPGHRFRRIWRDGSPLLTSTTRGTFAAPITSVQENFNDEMGYFVPRKGIRKYAGYIG